MKKRELAAAILTPPTILAVAGAWEREKYTPGIFGYFPFEESIVASSDVSTAESTPTADAILLSTDEAAEKHIRWDFFETEIPSEAETYREADLTDGFLLIAEHAMTRSEQLSPVSVEFSNTRGVFGGPTEMQRTFEVRNRPSESHEPVIFTALEYWDSDGTAPKTLSVAYE